VKNWQKITLIFVGSGAVGVLSYLGSVKPDITVFITAANMAIVGLVSYFTGFKPTA
jgi:hypothetical protein